MPWMCTVAVDAQLRESLVAYHREGTPAGENRNHGFIGGSGRESNLVPFGDGGR